MQFENITKKELIELNLYPIQNFKKLQECISFGYFYRYVEKNESTRRSYLCTISPSSKKSFHEQSQKIYIGSFEKLSKEELEDFGFCNKSLFKVIWLQKYLKGEVQGIYNPQEYLKFDSDKEIANLHKRIRDLEIKLEEYITENKELKEKISNTEKDKNSLEKSRNKLLKIVEENKCIFDKMLFELKN